MFLSIFESANNLITVDGPDGSGKGTIVRVLLDVLIERYGQESTVHVVPGRFDQSQEAMRFGIKVKQLADDPSTVEHNECFLGALAANYRTVIQPELKKGKIVIADSSEIRSLAYIWDRGLEDAIYSTCLWIAGGKATEGILAKHRIILQTPPEDCLRNVLMRGKIDHGDPLNIAEAIRRQASYMVAERFVKELKTTAETSWIYLENARHEDPPRLYEHLRARILDCVLPELNLQ